MSCIACGKVREPRTLRRLEVSEATAGGSPVLDLASAAVWLWPGSWDLNKQDFSVGKASPNCSLVRRSRLFRRVCEIATHHSDQAWSVATLAGPQQHPRTSDPKSS